MSEQEENINTTNTDIVDNIVLGNVSHAKDDITSLLNQKNVKNSALKSFSEMIKNVYSHTA